MRLVAITLSFVFVSTTLFGQAGTGATTGVVSDPAGAKIAGANVEVRSDDTNARIQRLPPRPAPTPFLACHPDPVP